MFKPVVLVLGLIQCIEGKPIQLPNNNQSAFVGVQTCADVFEYYQFAGFNVYDCLQDTETKNVFWRVENLMSWSDARDICRASLTGDLAAPKTTAQRLIVMDLVSLKVTKNTRIYIGFQYSGNETTYVDGTSVQSYLLQDNPFLKPTAGTCGVVDYNWGYYPEGGPDSNDSDLGFWFQYADCDELFAFICQTYIS